MSDHVFNPARSSGIYLVANNPAVSGTILKGCNAVRIFNASNAPIYAVCYDSANEAAIAATAAEHAVPAGGIAIIVKKPDDDTVSVFANSAKDCYVQSGNVFYGE